MELLGLALIPVLIAVNGFFVSAEFALVSVRRTRVEELVNQGLPRARALMEAIDHLDRSVAAAQLGITLASLALGLASEPSLAYMIEPLFANVPGEWQGAVKHSVSVALTLAIITYLHVVFGEQMPKIAALQAAERIALWVAGPTNTFAKATGPLIRLMNGTSTLFLRWAGYRPMTQHEDAHSVDELRLLIEDTEEAGLIDSEAAGYVRNVFSLSNKKVRDIMVPWEKVMALELTTPSDQILQAVRDGAHTRMPVYQSVPSNIVGVVNTKDLFFLFSLRGIVNLDDAQYPAQFLDADDAVSNALRLFRKTKHPMAVVRDADKAVIGILTLEDVLEEIVGDIEDEQDDPNRRRALLAKTRRGFPGWPPRPGGRLGDRGSNPNPRTGPRG
ncbi:Magnesium and cobalt efflux protein CorC [Fimbriiglobus ruber]|uniref:Magnesium and cobalt efflux protein CorC n=1 Tax=Fimbriiglobus ruber TaxID=1908690 RepID=A0A225E2W9_9BACT|nr:Magnesium and cobalt efflux protein CorC [Fimbriiglobus ruber]